jgi:hypothetical protein
MVDRDELHKPSRSPRTESISLAGLDRIAQPLHGEFDILRLAGAGVNKRGKELKRPLVMSSGLPGSKFLTF